MSFRNLSPQNMFRAIAAEHVPTHRFDNSQEFAAWKDATWPLVKATLGDFPAKVDPNPQLLAEWDRDDLHYQRWLIDVAPHISATCVVAIPEHGEGEKLPGICCCHGHGIFGKESVMGNDASPDQAAKIAAHNYDYGRRMARAGYVTWAIDWIGFGERNDNRKPNHYGHNADRDWCNLYYLHATMLGMTSLSINVAHGMAATDFVCSLPHVDPERLGVMGLSGGGTMALWLGLCDERFKAVEVICYSDLWAHFGIRDLNYCGMQVAPGLYKLVDLPDLQGLIAPRPLLVDIGIYDDCFRVDTAMACYEHVREIYTAAGIPDHLWLDKFAGPHAWGTNQSFDFFGQYL